MAVKIRLRRMGRKQHPVYSLVATDSRSARDGKFIEDLGRYEPIADPAVVKLNADRIVYWLGQGAQPSDTARNLLQREGILLRSAMSRRGADADAIAAAVAEHQERRTQKATATPSRADRRAEALKAERAAAAEIAKQKAAERAEREAELQRLRDESEAAARAEREAAQAESAADAAALTSAADAPAADETPAAEADAAPEESSDVATGAAEGASPSDAATEETATEDAPAETEEAAPVADETPAEEAPGAASEDTAPVAEADAPAADETTTEEAPAEEAAPAAEASTDDAPASTDGDTLTTIHGVGPKYAEILQGAGLTTFAAIAEASLETLQAALTDAGSTTAGNEETWAEQAALLAAGDTAGHDALVERLRAE